MIKKTVLTALLALGLFVGVVGAVDACTMAGCGVPGNDYYNSYNQPMQGYGGYYPNYSYYPSYQQPYQNYYYPQQQYYNQNQYQYYGGVSVSVNTGNYGYGGGNNYYPWGGWRW